MQGRMCGGVLVVFGTLAVVSAADPAGGKPATVAEAAKVFDLSKFPLVEGAKEPHQRLLAELSYEATGDVKPIFEQQKKALVAQKWTELPGSYVSDESCSATFTKERYKLSLSAFPTGQPKAVMIALTNHGNLDLDKIPVPKGVKPSYSGPVNVMYLTEASVADTAAACRKLLLEQGWLPYGSAGGTASYKQNAVKLDVRVDEAPAQGGKTVIGLYSALMSADLPAPTDAHPLQYSDTVKQLSFDAPLSLAEVDEFYRTTLAKAGWEPTSEKPIKSSFKEFVIYRNEAKDLINVEMFDFEGKARVLVKHQSAAEVAAEEERFRLAQERKKKPATKPDQAKVPFSIPAGATAVKKDAKKITFQVGTGKTKGLVTGWQKEFTKAGWKEEAAVVEDLAGLVSLKKGDATLTINYTDTGVLPAEVTIEISGGELEAVTEKK